MVVEYAPYYPGGWKNLPDRSTPERAEALQNMENGIATNGTRAVLGWAYAQSYQLVSGTRDANDALISGTVIWPDGATGTFTADTVSTAFPGAIDAYHVTHVGTTTTTYTQPLMTRNANGAVTAQPAIVVT